MDRNTPLISILMPTYNGEQYLRRTLDCLLQQTFKEWEIIAVDDNSTDNTLGILKEYAQNYPRHIRFATIPHSGSPRIPRLKAATMSNAEWICAIDSDDLVEPNYLQKLFTRAQETNADIVCPIMEYTTTNGTVFQQVPPHSFDFNRIYSGREGAMLTFCNGAGSLLSQNATLCKRGLFITALSRSPMHGEHIYQDEIDNLYLFLSATKIACCTARYTYFRNPNSVTHQSNPKVYDKLLTEIEYANICRRAFADDPTAVRKANGRFLSVFVGRRMKYLKDKTTFSTAQRREIKKMFRTAWPHLSLQADYSAKKKWLFRFGFNGFLLTTSIIHAFNKLR